MRGLECSVAVWNSEGGQGIRHWLGIALALGLMAAGEQGRSSDGGQLIQANPADPAKQAHCRPVHTAARPGTPWVEGRLKGPGPRRPLFRLQVLDSGGMDALLAYELP